MSGLGDGPEAGPSGGGDDTRLVHDAAGALDVTEFELFEMAHRAWFGARGAGEALERAFGRYMMRGEAPPWVRHFARRVLAAPTDAKRRDLLQAVHPRRPPAPPPPGGRLYVALTLGVFAVFLLLLLDVSYDPDTSAPMTCRGGPGMQSFVATIARAFGAELAC